jgi:hypothetical protein
MKLLKISLFILIIAFLQTACDSKPKVIQAESVSASVTANSIPSLEGPAITSFDAVPDEHEVVVKEVLNTEKYSYLKVDEGGENYWVAISKTDIVVGDTYKFSKGLLKKNFYSKEFNRVFETVYLVSKLWKKRNPNSEASAQQVNIPSTETLPDLKVEKIEPKEGAISLADLHKNQADYNGQVIKVTGKIVKINPMIMNRNWLHIQDGSEDGLDLTVTTNEVVRLGDVVTLEGTVVLDKDFGAGYRYDLIMEGAVLK